MKFKYIGVGGKSYGGVDVATGDVVELDDFFSAKAEKNPNYEQFSERKTRKPKEQAAVEQQEPMNLSEAE